MITYFKIIQTSRVLLFYKKKAMSRWFPPDHVYTWAELVASNTANISGTMVKQQHDLTDKHLIRQLAGIAAPANSAHINRTSTRSVRSSSSLS
jgi:hypothetical protein